MTRAEYELQLARARLQAPTSGGREVAIVAPVDGIVLKRVRESESVVPVGEPLLEIGDPQRLEIVADLLSTDAVRVPPGAPVILEQWGGGQPLQARVRRVEPSGFMKVSALGVEEQRVNVLIDFVDVAAAARALGDNYRVEVRIVIWSAEQRRARPRGESLPPRRGVGGLRRSRSNGRGCGPFSSASATRRSGRSPAACRPARSSSCTRPTR